MTENMQATLLALRTEHEREEVDANGIKWGLVYLNNVRQDKAFTGTLSALTKEGFYKPYNNGEKAFFGFVRL